MKKIPSDDRRAAYRSSNVTGAMTADGWNEYRQAMVDQGKCMILIEPTRWSPVSTGGFPPELFDD